MQRKFINRGLMVSTIVFMALSCKNDDADPIPVHGANFETEVATTGDGKKIIFKNTSANAASAIWLFGDGTTSDEMSPTHVYATQGTYSVELISIGVEGSAPITSRKALELVVTLPPIALCDVKPAASNFIKGGEFESTDHWTINSMSGVGLVDANYEFGSTTNPACTNTGKSLRIDNLTPYKDNGNLIWQSLGVLKPGRYRFSGDVNIQNGESQTPNDPNAGRNYFIETFLLDTAPEDGKSLSGDVTPKALISGFNAWEGGATNDIPSGKGSFPVIAFPYQRLAFLLANDRGEFEITAEKEYFFAMQFGTYGGSYGNGGITIDNFAIVKLED